MLLPLGPQTTGQIVQVLKGMEFYCSGTRKAVSKSHWHLLCANGSDDKNTYNCLVFYECDKSRILYIAFEAKNAMFNVYDDFESAMNSRPILRDIIKPEEQQEQTFEDNEEWKPDNED